MERKAIQPRVGKEDTLPVSIIKCITECHLQHQTSNISLHGALLYGKRRSKRKGSKRNEQNEAVKKNHQAYGEMCVRNKLFAPYKA